MRAPKWSPRGACAVTAFALCLTFGLLSHPAGGAVTTYNFDVDGDNPGFGVANGSIYDWDDTTNGGFWSNNSVSTTGATTTNGWVQGNFPKFQPAGSPTYTVNVSNEEQVAGMFFSTAQTVTINAVGTGHLYMASGLQGLLGSGSASVTINAPITGPGQIQPSNGGNIFLNGVNTYSGGTNLTSTATLIHFNNDSSFGTYLINLASSATGTAFVPLLGSGGHTITIDNFFTCSTDAGVNFAADPNTPVVSTNTWTLGAHNVRLRNNGNSSSPLTLSNVVSGTGSVTLSSNNGSTIIFSGENDFSGTVNVTGPGGTGAGSSAVTLRLGAANTLSASTSLVLAGGILDPDGFHHDMSLTTLGLTSSTNPSTIDFGAGVSEVDFANSSGLTWTGKLNLANWDPSLDRLRFGTNPTGLTSDQLAAIEFNGGGFGTASLDQNGYLASPTPEPSMAIFFLGAPTLLLLRRRRSTAGKQVP
jgi:hypothetical protein